MKRLSKTEFLCTLARASEQAQLNMAGTMLAGYKIRDAIDRVGLPLPPFKNLNKADEELKDNPIFRAVTVVLDPPQSPAMAGMEIAILFVAAHMEAAWKHYDEIMHRIEQSKEQDFRLGQDA